MHPRSFKKLSADSFRTTPAERSRTPQHLASYSPLHKICHLTSTKRKQIMMMEYVYMGAFPIGGRAMAFTADFFFWSTFFFHFYEISRPRSSIFFLSFFPTRFAP